jgi:transcriptional regulator with XRE-family HTH domain
MNTLSLQLKNLIQTAGISESELARCTGVPQQVINRLVTGKNTNPKITTLSLIAKYFNITISQLLKEELLFGSSDTILNKIPLLAWDELGLKPLNLLINEGNDTISIESNSCDSWFATKLLCDSMEPKFAKGTLLIFDKDKEISHLAFGLFSIEKKQEIIFRQIFIKERVTYIKCLNPQCECHKLVKLSKDYIFLGTLVQSRSDYY